jgi:hypothetical protein
VSKEKWEQTLIEADLSKDPFTAEMQLIYMDQKPTNEILKAIFNLKKLIIFEAFQKTEGSD